MAVTGCSWIVAGGLTAWAAGRVAAVDRVRRTESVVVPLMSFTPQVAKAAPWAVLGLRAIYELMVLVSYYSLVATSMRVWRTPLMAGMEPVF